MNLLKRFYDRMHPAPVTPAYSTPASRLEATSAVAQARRDLNAVVSREPKVTEISGALARELERNHFAELIEASMRRKQ